MPLYLTLLALSCTTDSVVPDQGNTIVTDGGGYEIVLEASPDPYVAGSDSLLEVTVSLPGGDTPSDTTLTVTPWMPDHNHGVPDPPAIVEMDPAVFEATWMFSMPGTWTIDLELDSAEAGPDHVELTYEVE